MISKAEREKDKAVLAGLPPYIEIDEDGSIWDCPGEGAHVARVGDASDADLRPTLAHAANRLPAYIADAEEMDRRIAAMDERARMLAAAQPDDVAISIHVSGMREVIEFLRGSQ